MGAIDRTGRRTRLAVAAWLLPALLAGAGLCGAAEPAGQSPQKAAVFPIYEWRVAGNTLLDQRAVEAVLMPLLGAGRSFEDVEAAREALAAAYRDAGYPTVLVDIPEQTVQGGVVRLQVTEAPVGRLRVSDADYFSNRRIRDLVPALGEGQVIHLPRVQEQLTRLNTRSADMAVTPVLRPGRTPGTVEAELKVSDQLPLHGGLEVNGRNTANTSRSRATLRLGYDNLWQRQHALSLQYQFAPEKSDEVEVLAATYMLPVGRGGNRLVAYAVDSNTEVAALGDISVLGEGSIMGLRAVFPLGAGEGFFHSLVAGGDRKDFDESVRLGGDAFEQPITYSLLAVSYNATRSSESRLTEYRLGVSFAPASLNDREEFERKRPDSDSAFSYFTAGVEHTRELPWGFTGVGEVQGQWTDAVLVSNEQFSLGGAESVRGYLEAQLLGDSGLRGSAALRYVLNGLWTPPWLTQWYAAAFADAGLVWINEPDEGQRRSDSLSGAGIGLHLLGRQHLKAGVDLAWALEDAGEVEQGEARAHFSVELEF